MIESDTVIYEAMVIATGVDPAKPLQLTGLMVTDINRVNAQEITDHVWEIICKESEADPQ